MSVAAYVFDAPLGTLIATSGVLAIILGLALQSTLADVFSGIVLSDGTEGRIIETNWRSTYLLDGSNDLVVLPNSSLAKTRITNVSSPSRSHGVSLSVRLMPTQAPAAIAAVMRNVLLSSNSIMAVPPPSVEIRSLDALAVEFKLSFRVADFDTAAKARHEVYDLVYRHARAAGLLLAYPPQALVATSVPAPATAQAAAPSTAAQRLLDAVPLFASLADAERSTLADAMTRKTYRKGEVLGRAG